MNIDNLPMFKLLSLSNVDPSREAYIFANSDGSDETITMMDIYKNANRLARILLSSGIGYGDSFVILMRNHPEFLYAIFAALTIGAVAVPIDPRTTGEKLTYQIKNSQAKGILMSGEFMKNVEAVASHIREIPVIAVTYKEHHGVAVSDKYPDLETLFKNESGDLPEKTAEIDLKRPFQIIYTSGTTGDPKGVVLKAERYMLYGVLRALWGYQNDDIPYTGLSLTHGNAQAVTVFPALAGGIKAVIGEKFTKSKIWDICRKYGCTTFSLLGGMMMGIYSEPQKLDDADNPVRVLISAGTPQAIWKEFEKRFGVKIFEWYGAVEGGFAYNPPGTGPLGSFGKPPEGIYEMKLVKEDDIECAPREIGELVFRPVGAKAEVEYYRNKKASEDKTRGGWQRTGDMCHRDADGWFYFDFRKGGGLRRQGDFIQPEYIEKVFAELPEVSDVCVYGIPAKSGAPGESDIVAAIVPAAGETIHPQSIFAEMTRRLERNAVPSYLQIVPEIPKTASEKNLDRLLKDAFRKDASNVFAFSGHF